MDTPVHAIPYSPQIRQAKRCGLMSMISLVGAAVVTPVGGEPAIAAWTFGGTMAFIFGLSGIILRQMSGQSFARRQASRSEASVFEWTYSRQEWSLFADQEWDRVHGVGFRVGLVVTTLFGSLLGGLLGSWTGAGLGALAGMIFVGCLRAINRFFLAPCQVPSARMTNRHVFFGELDFELSEGDCHLYQFDLDNEHEPPVLSLFFRDQNRDLGSLRIPVPLNHRDGVSKVLSFLEHQIRENETLFYEDDADDADETEWSDE